ncbi:unnamed protein product [Durusdinium trenchii]|uniref:Uncharacterized protein n=3 Tax=Durusdinium trenchii TaxID=1381693 RepID=A0ABP0JQB6_9DINO
MIRQICAIVLPLVSSLGDESCIPGGVSAEDRSYFPDEEPLRVIHLEGASSMLLTAVARVLIEEILGYHVLVGTSTSAEQALLGLAGCELTGRSSLSCQERSLHHVVINTFGRSLPENPTFQELLQNGAQQRVQVHSMGFLQEQRIWIGDSLRRSAFEERLLLLDHFRTYNSSRRLASEYFSNASDVNRSDLTACSELGAFDQYLALTGDADGVVYASGSSTLRCVNGVWWLAPACRLAPSECIPLLLRAEWKMLAVMVSAAKHSMPVRIGHVESWERFVHLVKNVPVLYSIGGIPIQPSSIWNLKRCFCPVLLPRHTPASRSPRLWR